jgi:1-deoxy-D-xylulose-5-phosphate synthase
MLRRIKENPGPVLLHVITRKGKGYKPAEQKPEEFHSAVPFHVRTGKRSSPPAPSFSQTFGETAVELAEKDSAILCITAAMARGTGLDPFRERFPGRLIDVGIAEEHAVILAAGLAASGYRPIVAIYSTFLQRAFDQMLHDVCLQKLPVVFGVDRAGFSGEDGPTHHGVFDLSYLGMMPNMTVAAPKDRNELRNMLHFAVAHSGPVAVRYSKGSGMPCDVAEPIEPIELGKAKVEREGRDVAILALGSMVEGALSAATALQEEGISTMVVNARFAKPLDRDLIRKAARTTGCLLTLEENVLAGGFGSQVSQVLEEDNLDDCRLAKLGVPDTFIKHGARDRLLEEVGLSALGIAKIAKASLVSGIRGISFDS